LEEAAKTKTLSQHKTEIQMIAQNQTFNDITIYIDGSTYMGCTFQRCIMVFSGVLPVHIVGNKFIQCKWEFAGPAANTVGFLTSLYAGGARDLVEQIFDAVRKNATGQRRASDPIILH
jgi:hypothetical protein